MSLGAVTSESISPRRDQRLDNRRRDGDVKALRILLNHVDAQAASRAINATRHRDVEGIGIHAGHEGQIVAVVQSRRRIAGIAGVNEARHIGIIDIVDVDHGVASGDARGDAAHAIKIRCRQRHAQITHISRLLRDHQRNNAVL